MPQPRSQKDRVYRKAGISSGYFGLSALLPLLISEKTA
jgi:hypothetical protein